MGEEVSLARSQEDGQGMLLAGASTGEFPKASSHRDKRQKENTNASREESRKAKNSTPKGKGTPAAKNSDAGAPGGYGQSDKAREYSGDTSTRDIPGGRSAEELGLEWIDAECSACPRPPHVHYWIGGSSVDSGNIFICKFCQQIQWWPSTIAGAAALDSLMEKYGTNTGYQIMLDNHPVARNLLFKAREIRYLRQFITTDDIIVAVAAVMKEKI